MVFVFIIAFFNSYLNVLHMGYILFLFERTQQISVFVNVQNS